MNYGRRRFFFCIYNCLKRSIIYYDPFPRCKIPKWIFKFRNFHWMKNANNEKKSRKNSGNNRTLNMNDQRLAVLWYVCLILFLYFYHYLITMLVTLTTIHAMCSTAISLFRIQMTVINRCGCIELGWTTAFQIIKKMEKNINRNARPNTKNHQQQQQLSMEWATQQINKKCFAFFFTRFSKNWRADVTTYYV